MPDNARLAAAHLGDLGVLAAAEWRRLPAIERLAMFAAAPGMAAVLDNLAQLADTAGVDLAALAPYSGYRDPDAQEAQP
jgi:hypothetical protein